MRFPRLLAISRAGLTALLVVQVGLLPIDAQQMMDQSSPQASTSQHVSSKPLESRQDEMKASGQQLNDDEKILMALDRFTYGLRPGDFDHVKKIGLSEWFNEQLNPQTIDDSALNKRLAAYPAMQLSLDRMMEMYPDNNMLRASLNRDGGHPMGAAAGAIYRNGEERYQDKKTKKADKGKKGEDYMSDNVTEASSTAAAAFIAMAPEKRFRAICKLNLSQWQNLRRGSSPSQRAQLLAGLTPEQVEALAAFSGPQRVVSAEDIQTKIMRDIYTERQLQEVMVDFWLNHFNVYMKKSQQAPYYIATYVRQVIRPNALGNFSNLLAATATSPAMLTYLDNSESVGAHSDYALHGPRTQGRYGIQVPQQQKKKANGLNENYARELMELHTIGVNGGYTQHDVTEVAKVFTGWTVDREDPGAQQTRSTFDASKHEPGSKLVLGHVIKENGSQEGFSVLKMLAQSPQCARFISTKLAVRFVSDNPPPALIDRMVGTFLETKGDIRRVLVTMVNSPEFFTTASYRSKVKTPQDFVVSAVRVAGSDVHSTAGLVTAIADLGMPVYGMQTPQGYSMKSEAWNSTTALVSRMNFALALASNRVAGVHTNFEALLGADAATMTPQDKARLLEVRLLHMPISERTASVIEAQTSAQPEKQMAELRQVSVVGKGQDPLMVAFDNATIRKDLASMDTQAAIAAGLILGSPEFQRR